MLSTVTDATEEATISREIAYLLHIRKAGRAYDRKNAKSLDN